MAPRFEVLRKVDDAQSLFLLLTVEQWLLTVLAHLAYSLTKIQLRTSVIDSAEGKTQSQTHLQACFGTSVLSSSTALRVLRVDFEYSHEARHNPPNLEPVASGNRKYLKPKQTFNLQKNE